MKAFAWRCLYELQVRFPGQPVYILERCVGEWIKGGNRTTHGLDRYFAEHFLPQG